MNENIILNENNRENFERLADNHHTSYRTATNRDTNLGTQSVGTTTSKSTPCRADGGDPVTDHALQGAKHSVAKKSIPTLCWGCRYATGLPLPPDKCGTHHKCPWVDHYEPVDGWTAQRTAYGTGHDYVESYYITECPLYAPDLEQQLVGLSDAEIAYYLTIPETTARIYRNAAIALLYHCIQNEGYYQAKLAKKEGDFELSRIDVEKCSESLLLTLDITETSIKPFGEKVRNMAITDFVQMLKEDNEVLPTGRRENYLMGVSEIIKAIKRVKKRKKQAAAKGVGDRNEVL